MKEKLNEYIALEVSAEFQQIPILYGVDWTGTCWTKQLWMPICVLASSSRAIAMADVEIERLE